MKPLVPSAKDSDAGNVGPVDPVSGRLHNPWLDWLRFVAALAVVMNHTRTDMFVEYGNLDPSSKGPLTFAWAMSSRLGYEAVLVFFVLSGFLVGGKALRLALDRKFNWRSYLIPGRLWQSER